MKKMGKKGRWFDAVQRILTKSGPDHEKEDKKAERSKDKSNLKKIWQFSKNNPSDPSASAALETAPVAHEQPPPPPSQPDQHQEEEIKETKSAETAGEGSYRGYSASLASSIAAQATAVVAQAAAAVARATATTPRAPAHSKEELAAIKIQTACRGYLARRTHQERGMARLMSLVEGVGVRRQIEETLYCMQTMTRVQTQIYSRRVKMEEDKKALKSQILGKQGVDKTKTGEGWDHSHQTKEQMEAVLAMKQEAASRRQRALSYAFSHQWRNRNPSSGSARATPPPMYMDPGCPNWGWSWTERWMAAARPWESQTAPDKDRTPPAKSARRRVSISVQIPMTPGRSVRPPSCPSPSTPTPRSPSVLGRASSAVPAPSPRCSPLHRSMSGLQRTTSLQSERPRSSQERPGSSSPLHGGNDAALRRTASLRSGDMPRRLSLGGVALARDVEASAPVTPSYMQPTKSVRAKARCPGPAVSDKVELPERAPAQVSPPSVKKRLTLELADKPSVSSPSKVKADRAKRHSQPPSPKL